MSSNGKIEQLARLAGIEPEYEDAWETMQHLSPQRMKGLLRLLRIPVDDDAQVQASIGGLQAESWQGTLSPAYVVRANRTPKVALVVPRSAAHNATLQWRVKLEDGSEQQGAAEAGALERLEEAQVDGRWLERRLLELPDSLPPGVHTLAVHCNDGSFEPGEARLILAPEACYIPPSLADEARAWGLAVQLYALRSRRNWGIGDFTDLFDLVEIAQGFGVGLIGLNPLHALFPTQPERASPYAPSSRLFLNVLYVDVERVPDYAECPQAQRRVDAEDFQHRLEALRRSELVDYSAVARCKLEILELLYQEFRARHLDGAQDGAERARRFRRFQREGGPALRMFTTFEALSESMAREGRPRPWEEWPDELRDPRGEAVREFVRRNPERVEYFEYLQWVAAEQLAEVAARCEALDMPVGLYLDLAIGVARDGADVWADQAAYVADASVGAPPDAWNLKGQDWGLPPLHPRVLRERAYQPFADVLGANMKYAGALRIDHVLALMHLYWTPVGAGPKEGGYVRYPLEDMLGTLALHSRRSRCLVVGEDLGTVPRPFKERLQQDGLLSYKLLYFEKTKEGRFLAPSEYPRLALAAITTHDLPTLPGYWLEHDLRLRERLDLFPSPEQAREAFSERAQDRRELVAALTREGLHRETVASDSGELDQPLVEALYTYLARSPCLLLMVQLEDVLGETEQTNVPGTTDQYPNWRRKLHANLDELGQDPRLATLARRLRAVRQPH